MNRSSPSDQTLLALARKKRGWTQAYVAKQVGVSVGTVRRWEGGQLPYPASIQKLCHLFALSAHELGLFKDPHHPASSETETRRWEADDAEKQAAWEIYVELVTRVPLAVLEDDQGLLREALSSLYSLFQTTRTSLRQLGPGKARPDAEPTRSCSYLAVRMLNVTLRPFLSKWHPFLKDYEEQRPITMGVLEHERRWKQYVQFRQEMGSLRKALLDDANGLAQIAGTPSLIIDAHGKERVD